MAERQLPPVRLRPLEPDDAAWLAPMMNDRETTKWMATGRVPISVSGLTNLIGRWETESYAFGVFASPGVAVGYVGLWDADFLSLKAELRILLGLRRGKGYGRAATMATLDFGFRRLGLHRIWLGVTAENTAAVKCYEACGFRVEGRLVDDLWRDGEWYDSIRMAVVREKKYGDI